MSIQDWGSIGELIGALGLLITVCFLVYELRLTRAAIAHKDYSETISRNETFWSGVVGNTRLLETFTSIHELTQELKGMPTLEQIKARIAPIEFTRWYHHCRVSALNFEAYLSSLERGYMVQGEFEMAFAPKTKDYIYWRELGLSVGRRTTLHFEKIVCVLDSRSEFSARQGEAVKTGRPITDTGQIPKIGMGD